MKHFFERFRNVLWSFVERFLERYGNVAVIFVILNIFMFSSHYLEMCGERVPNISTIFLKRFRVYWVLTFQAPKWT